MAQGVPFTIQELRQFRRVSRWRAPLDIAASWLLCAGFFAAVRAVDSLAHLALALTCGAPILGALQNRLATLLHDAMHRSLHPKKSTSDFLGKWFCAYPIGNFFHINLIMHANHHYEFGMRRDPNVLAYTVSCETFRKRDLPRLLFGIGLLSALLNFDQKLANKFRFSEDASAIDAERKLKKQALKKDYPRVIGVQLALFAMFALAGMWWAYLYWVAVRNTFTSAFAGIRLFVEHHSDIADARPILANTGDHTRINTAAGLLERFFIAPLNFNLHGTHHVAPFVPYYQLEELTRMIAERDVKYFVSRKGYMRYVLGLDDYSAEEGDLLPIQRRQDTPTL